MNFWIKERKIKHWSLPQILLHCPGTIDLCWGIHSVFVHSFHFPSGLTYENHLYNEHLSWLLLQSLLHPMNNILLNVSHPLTGPTETCNFLKRSALSARNRCTQRLRAPFKGLWVPRSKRMVIFCHLNFLSAINITEFS